MVLCENRDSLKFIKKIEVIEVGRTMKQANVDLFEEFLERVVGGADKLISIRQGAFPHETVKRFD